jgi:hypothetical protein
VLLPGEIQPNANWVTPLASEKLIVASVLASEIPTSTDDGEKTKEETKVVDPQEDDDIDEELPF